MAWLVGLRSAPHQVFEFAIVDADGIFSQQVRNTVPAGDVEARRAGLQCFDVHFDRGEVHFLDYLLSGLTGISEPLSALEPRLGRRTALTFPLLPPPQKN